MNGLDLLLLLLLLAYALSGYWQGFITGAFATAGLLGGGFFGIWVSPILFGESGTAIWVPIAALFVVLLSASFGQAVLQHLGVRIRDQVTWQPARVLDALGGAALSVAAVLVVTWALGVAVSSARLPWVSEQVRSSEVLSRVNAVMPGQATRALNGFTDVVASSVFPRYLEPFAPERIEQVGPPPPRIAQDPDVQAAAASVLKIRGENRCNEGVEGTGFLYAPDRIMTNAHVVAGVDDPVVVTSGGEVPARTVYYNPDLDVAVLAVDGLGLPHLGFDRDGERGDPGAVLGYPNNGPYDVQAARIRAEQRLRSPDIYGAGTVVREVFSVRSLIRPGNSGGPMVSPGGDVLGVVFAASVSDQQTGYVLTADQVSEAAATGITRSQEVSSGGCA